MFETKSGYNHFHISCSDCSHRNSVPICIFYCCFCVNSIFKITQMIHYLNLITIIYGFSPNQMVTWTFLYLKVTLLSHLLPVNLQWLWNALKISHFYLLLHIWIKTKHRQNNGYWPCMSVFISLSNQGNLFSWTVSKLVIYIIYYKEMSKCEPKKHVDCF